MLLREIARGLKVGMVLQLAVGPVFAFVLNVALVADVPAFLGAVLGVTLVDALSRREPFFRGRRQKTRSEYALSGSSYVFRTLYPLRSPGGLALRRVRSSDTHRHDRYPSVSLCGCANRLLSAYDRFLDRCLCGLQHFAAGCVLATFLFLASTGIFARYFAGLLSPAAIAMLNALAGLVLLCYGAKKALQSLQR